MLAGARAAVAASAEADTPQPHAAATAPAPRAAAPLAADAADPGARPRRRARWPAWTGLAASLTLAVGIAWQLRTPAPPVVPEPTPAATSAKQAAAERPVDPQEAATASAAADDAPQNATAVTPPAPPSTPAPKRAPAAADRDAMRAAPAPAAADLPAAAEPALMVEPPSPVAPPAPAMPAPANALAPAQPQALAKPATRSREADAAQHEDRRVLQQRRQDRGERAGNAAASAQAWEAEGDAARVEGNLSAVPATAPLAAIPDAPVAAADAYDADPAFAAAVESDAGLPPRRWLARVRERRDAGEHAAARASLQRLQREHPHTRIPDDLRDLLDH